MRTVEDCVSFAIQDTTEANASQTSGAGSIGFGTDALPRWWIPAWVELAGGGFVGNVTFLDYTFKGGATNTLTARVFVRTPADDQNADQDVFHLRAGGVGTHVIVRWDASSQAWVLEAGGTDLATHAHAGTTLGVWYAIEVSLDDAGGANKFQLRTWKFASGERLVTESTHANIAGTWDTARLSAGGFNAADTSPFRFAQYVMGTVYNDDYHSYIGVLTVRPDEDVNVNWTPNGGGANWVEVDETPPDNDTSYNRLPQGNVLTDRLGVERPLAPAQFLHPFPFEFVGMSLKVRNEGTAPDDLNAAIYDHAGVQRASVAGLGTGLLGSYTILRNEARYVPASGLSVWQAGEHDVEYGGDTSSALQALRVTTVSLSFVGDMRRHREGAHA